MGRLLVFAAALSIAGSVASAQQRPDFSGEWSVTEDRAPSVATAGDASFRRGDMGSGWGSTIRIAQGADSLIVTYVFFSSYDLQPPLRFVFAMDGAESRNVVMIGHAASEQRSRLSWQDNTLVITTVHLAPKSAEGRAAAAEVRQALTLESPTSLVVETTRSVLGGQMTRTRTVYTKR